MEDVLAAVDTLEVMETLPSYIVIFDGGRGKDASTRENTCGVAN